MSDEDIARLTAENELLRAACAALLPLVEGLCDEGPEDEGWQSDELVATIDVVRAAVRVMGSDRDSR